MSSTAKPNWLVDATGLSEVTNFHLFPPKNVGSLTSLADTSSFERGLRQYLYWKGQLLPSITKTTLFLAFLGPKGLIMPNVENIAKALRPLCDFAKLIEVYQGANTNFLAFSFEKASVVKEIIDNFKYFDDSIVLTISFRGEGSHRFRLLWLPPLFDISRVHHMLGGLSLSHCLKRESLHIGDGKYSPTNIVSGTLTVKPGTTVHQLPYLIKLPSPHKGCALLHIDSRPPMCLKCRAIGHTRKKCLMTRCTACSKVHFPQSACGVSSYASVATKGITNCQEDDWIGLLAEVSDTDPTDLLTGSSANLSSLVTSDPNPGLSSIITQPFTPLEDDSSQDLPLHPVDPREKCGRTFLVSTDDPSASLHLPADILTSDAVQQESLEFFISPAIHPSSQLPSEAFTSTISTGLPTISTNNTNFSPPTRKRHILPDSRYSLRSESLHYSPYSAKPSKAKTTDDLITSHFSALDSSIIVSPVTPVGALEPEREDLSDVSVDLSLGEEVMDTYFSEKTFSSASLSLHSPAFETFSSDIEDNVPLATLSKLNSSDLPSLAETELHVPDTSLPVLSDADASLAEQLALSPHNFIRIKLATPKQDISANYFKKLKLLISNSISLLAIPDHPQFFNISYTALAARIKLLHKNSLSCNSVLDLIQPVASYERIQGHIPPSRPLLPHVNPFASSESPT